MRSRNFTFLLILLCFAFTSTFAQTARVQVIHNSPDAAASTVDVWLDNTLLLDDFSFRTASPFVNAPAGTNFDITIQPSNSVDTTNGLWRNTYNLTSGNTYILVASGIISPTGYSPAPAFDILVNGMGREAASMPGNTDVLVMHGSTDAPTVDVVEVGVGAGTIVDDASYGDFTPYLELLNADYSLQVRTSDGTTTVAQFDAPLATLSLAGGAAVVLASGFLDPSVNSNGPAFGLYAALPTGGPLVALPPAAISTARVQVIHNSPDAAAATVDIWLGNSLLIDDFEFRTASPFVDAPAGVPIEIRVSGANSMDTTNPVGLFTYTLTGGEKYIIAANGIVSATGYSPAPAFGLDVFAGAKEKAALTANTEILVLHGSTDAPTVDIYETTAALLADDMSYMDYAGYLDLPTADYEIQVRDMAGANTLFTYSAPLATLALDGEALTVLASGFVDPSVNSNGSPFGLWVALAAGGPLVQLPVATGIGEVEAGLNDLVAFPNPTAGSLSIQMDLKNNSKVNVVVLDLMGSKVLEQEMGRMNAGMNRIDLDLNTLPQGNYLYRITTDKGIASGKFVKVN